MTSRPPADGEFFYSSIVLVEEVPRCYPYGVLLNRLPLTSAAGFAELETEEGSDNMEYDIIAINIDKVTQAHIHQGTSSEAGPVIATLFNASTPTGPTSGELTDGFITSANLEGPLQGKQLSDLIALMQNGQAYVNVHTEQNPDGEIRGTIVADTD